MPSSLNFVLTRQFLSLTRLTKHYSGHAVAARIRLWQTSACKPSGCLLHFSTQGCFMCVAPQELEITGGFSQCHPPAVIYAFVTKPFTRSTTRSCVVCLGPQRMRLFRVCLKYTTTALNGSKTRYRGSSLPWIRCQYTIQKVPYLILKQPHPVLIYCNN